MLRLVERVVVGGDGHTVLFKRRVEDEIADAGFGDGFLAIDRQDVAVLLRDGVAGQFAVLQVLALQVANVPFDGEIAVLERRVGDVDFDLLAAVDFKKRQQIRREEAFGEIVEGLPAAEGVDGRP